MNCFQQAPEKATRAPADGYTIVISNVPAMNEIYPGFEFIAWFAL